MARLADRLLGMLFGALAGALVYMLIIALSTFLDHSYHPLLAGLGSALFLGLSIWGWSGGAYALGRIVAWLRQK